MKSYSIATGNSYEQLTISDINVSYVDYWDENPYNTTFTRIIIWR